jgi:gluconate kinase
MDDYIKWLENKIELCLEDKELQREHWAFCQALKKYRELLDDKNTHKCVHNPIETN